MKLNKKIEEVQGHLHAMEEQKIDHLDFTWEDIKFTAALKNTRAQVPTIELTAALGRLPFTIEDSVKRGMALEQLFMTNRVIDGAYSLEPKGNVHFKSSTSCTPPLNNQSFMHAVTLILLEGEKHLRGLKAFLKPC